MVIIILTVPVWQSQIILTVVFKIASTIWQYQLLIISYILIVPV